MPVKRKRDSGNFGAKKKFPLKPKALEEEIESDLEIDSDEAEGLGRGERNDDIEDDDFFETPAEKKVRLAKEHLKKIGVGEENEEDIAERLLRDAEAASKKVHYTLGDNIHLGQSVFLKGHKLPPTCICLSEDGRTAWTGGKDCSILQWDLETGKKTVFPGARNNFTSGGHFRSVLSITYVEHSNLICSGGADNLVRLWDARQAGSRCIDVFKGHTGSITALAAEPGGTEQLYSSSSDKSVKTWSLSMRSYIDTQFGHTAAVNDMDILVKDRPLTVGEDRTARLWKVSNETHLVFPQTSAADCCTMLNANLFATGGLDGSISLWSASSRKPVAVVEGERAHSCKGITSLTSIPFSDILMSGSSDGTVKVWQSVAPKDSGMALIAKTGTDKKGKGKGSLRLIAQCEAEGFINSMKVSKGGGVLACVVSKETKQGRWGQDKAAANGIMVVPLKHSYVGKL